MIQDLFPWHFNLHRHRTHGTTIERTAFSPTGKDDFYVPEKFAKLWGEVRPTKGSSRNDSVAQ